MGELRPARTTRPSPPPAAGSTGPPPDLPPRVIPAISRHRACCFRVVANPYSPPLTRRARFFSSPLLPEWPAWCAGWLRIACRVALGALIAAGRLPRCLPCCRRPSPRPPPPTARRTRRAPPPAQAPQAASHGESGPQPAVAGRSAHAQLDGGLLGSSAAHGSPAACRRRPHTPPCALCPQWFAKIDANSSGTLDVMELQRALALGGLNFSLKTVQAMMRLHDRSGDGQVRGRGRERGVVCTESWQLGCWVVREQQAAPASQAQASVLEAPPSSHSALHFIPCGFRLMSSRSCTCA